ARAGPCRDWRLSGVMVGRLVDWFSLLAAAASALGRGKFTVLAVSSPKRVALLPDVPSIVEAGYPNAVFRFWVGLSAPAGTPAAIVNKMHDAAEKKRQDPGLKEKVAKIWVETGPNSGGAVGKFVKGGIPRTVDLAKQAHIEPLD